MSEYPGYLAVQGEEDIEKMSQEDPDVSISTNLSSRKNVLVLIAIILTTGALIYVSIQPLLPFVPLCDKPRSRQEWRTLSTPQKLTYLQNVKCLQQRPSKLAVGGSRYDDFPYIHRAIGYKSHEKANFLLWHRYFIAIFEMRLREECGYDGPMPYWDWVRDCHDLASSPVFDTQLGFGGNGDVMLEESIVGGYCVTDGPFAMLPVRNDSATGHFSGDLVRPDVMDQIMQEEDFREFNLKLEDAPHNAIPFGIRGDFLSFNAPADPLFFLHHAQLDRLLWKWQNSSPTANKVYNAKISKDVKQTLSSKSVIEMGALAKNVVVGDIIDTKGGLLCYDYDD